MHDNPLTPFVKGEYDKPVAPFANGNRSYRLAEHLCQLYVASGFGYLSLLS